MVFRIINWPSVEFHYFYDTWFLSFPLYFEYQVLSSTGSSLTILLDSVGINLDHCVKMFLSDTVWGSCSSVLSEVAADAVRTWVSRIKVFCFTINCSSSSRWSFTITTQVYPRDNLFLCTMCSDCSFKSWPEFHQVVAGSLSIYMVWWERQLIWVSDLRGIPAGSSTSSI